MPTPDPCDARFGTAGTARVPGSPVFRNSEPETETDYGN